VTLNWTASPRIISPLASATVDVQANNSLINDNVTITYNYKIGGASGSCTFTSLIR
jgi:hypothetical protein